MTMSMAMYGRSATRMGEPSDGNTQDYEPMRELCEEVLLERWSVKRALGTE